MTILIPANDGGSEMNLSGISFGDFNISPAVLLVEQQQRKQPIVKTNCCAAPHFVEGSVLPGVVPAAGFSHASGVIIVDPGKKLVIALL